MVLEFSINKYLRKGISRKKLSNADMFGALPLVNINALKELFYAEKDPRKIHSNRTILIVVEGTTEFNYFSEMKTIERIPGITVIPNQSKYSLVASIFKTAFEEQKTKVYDFIWCVFDCDTISKTTPYKKLEELKQQVYRYIPQINI